MKYDLISHGNKPIVVLSILHNLLFLTDYSILSKVFNKGYLIISKCMRLKTSRTIIKVIFPCPNEFFTKPESEDFAENTKINATISNIQNFFIVFM